MSIPARSDSSATELDRAPGDPPPDPPEGNGIAVLVVDDEEPFRQLLERKFRRKGYKVVAAASGPAALAMLEREGELDVAVLDMSITPEMDGIELLREVRKTRPSIEAIILTGHGTIDNAVESVKLGAFHYLEKPCRFEELEAHVVRAYDKRRLARENADLRAELQRVRPSTEIVGQSQSVREVRDLIGRFAVTDSPVLVEGASGTGKELVARALHDRSPRRDRPFIAINCGALSATLLENELFGHTKGAFTGADRDRPGLFEEAHKGTLFIDEVCEMDLEVQKKFLRVLENGELRRLGEAKIRKVDVRIVAATNKVVREEVERGEFRQDLFFRLDVLHLNLPPLCERTSDIPMLVEHFLGKNRGRFAAGIRVDESVMAAFAAYEWPGNVRELFNLLERGAILTKDGVIRLHDVPGLAGAPTGGPAAGPAPRGPTPQRPVSSSGERLAAGPPEPISAADGPAPTSLSEIEALHVKRVLDQCDGNKTAAARLLGISLRSLYRKLEKLDS